MYLQVSPRSGGILDNLSKLQSMFDSLAGL